MAPLNTRHACQAKRTLHPPGGGPFRLRSHRCTRCFPPYRVADYVGGMARSTLDPEISQGFCSMAKVYRSQPEVLKTKKAGKKRR